jgi:metabolite-proton symporter
VDKVGGENLGQTSDIRRVALASGIGTTIEWYDYFAYANAAALVFGPLFFPEFSVLAGTLASLSTFAIGFVVRPFGGALFGHLGDKVGRKAMLVLSLLIMGVATFAIGLLPTYAAIGVAAPILLILLRLVQGFAVGGEWGGAVLMAVEHAPRNRRGFYGSWPQVGVPAGVVLSNLVFLVSAAALSEEQFAAWGWRVPFLISIVLVAVGLVIRLKIEESPVFARVKETRSEARMPIVDVFRTYPKEVVLAGAAFMANNVTGYTVQVYVLSYGTQALGLSITTMLTLVLVTAFIGIFGILGFSALSDRVGRRRVFLTGAVCQAAWALPFFWLIDTGSIALILTALVVMILASYSMYGPMAAMFAEIFGTRVRYTGASLGYQLGAIVGGGFAPLIAAALFAATGTSASVSIYIIAVTAISFAAVYLLGETYRRDIDEAPAGKREVVPEAEPHSL